MIVPRLIMISVSILFSIAAWNPLPLIIGVVGWVLIGRQEEIIQQAQEEHGYDMGCVHKIYMFVICVAMIGVGLLVLLIALVGDEQAGQMIRSIQ
jgi:hypothetical protein